MIMAKMIIMIIFINVEIMINYHNLFIDYLLILTSFVTGTL